MYMTLREFADRFGMSDENCNIMGLNPWCMNEGADPQEPIKINKEQAKELGIHDKEFEARS